MPRVTKATDAERAAYAATGAVYPLYGWVKHPSGHTLAIEDLRGCWRKPDPIYEVMAPSGHHFTPSACRSLLCHSLRDVASYGCSESLSKCDPDDCGAMN